MCTVPVTLSNWRHMTYDSYDSYDSDSGDLQCTFYQIIQVQCGDCTSASSEGFPEQTGISSAHFKFQSVILFVTVPVACSYVVEAEVEGRVWDLIGLIGLPTVWRPLDVRTCLEIAETTSHCHWLCGMRRTGWMNCMQSLHHFTKIMLAAESGMVWIWFDLIIKLIWSGIRIIIWIWSWIIINQIIRLPGSQGMLQLRNVEWLTEWMTSKINDQWLLLHF